MAVSRRPDGASKWSWNGAGDQGGRCSQPWASLQWGRAREPRGRAGERRGRARWGWEWRVKAEAGPGGKTSSSRGRCTELPSAGRGQVTESPGKGWILGPASRPAATTLSTSQETRIHVHVPLATSYQLGSRPDPVCFPGNILEGQPELLSRQKRVLTLM